MNKNKWFLNGGRGSGRAIRLLCETYENKIADLEKENAELRNNGFTVSAMTEQQLKVALEKGEQLEKENAELKKELEITRRCWYDQKNISLDTNCKLHKAKELLKRWVELYKPKLDGYPIPPIQEQTEQFLNENSTYERIQKAKYNYTD